jgi:hypothetical protein
MSVFFNGRLLVTPTVESAIYDQGLATAFPGRAGNIPVMIGTSDGGIPDQAMFFDSPVTARRALRGGNLLHAVEKAFNPSAETGSPARVAVVRVEKAEQSGIVLDDAFGNHVINIKSVDYGAYTNAIRLTIAQGQITGLAVTVQLEDNYYSKNNISSTPLTVHYFGSELTASVGVTATNLLLRAPSTSLTPIKLTLANYRTVRELCDAVNAYAGWSAVAKTPTDPIALDAMGYTTCKAAPADIKANLQAVIDWFNVYAREVVTATRVVGALYKPKTLLPTFLSGGTNGNKPTMAHWQDGFDILQEIDVQYVVPLTDSPSVWWMADAHCNFMSTTGKSERRAFVGSGVVSGTLANAIATAQTNAIALNSDRTALCFPPILDFDEHGELVPFPAYFLAAVVAGGFAAMNPGNTMTNKVITIPGLDPPVSSIYDSDTLINSGILGARKTKRGYIISKACPTWLSNDNYNRVEISTGIALDYVARTVRETLETFVGRKASPITLHEALSATESTLHELSIPEPIGMGVIVGDAASPAYRNITAEIQGDVLRVWFECSPVIPINYVLIGVYARANSGTATAAIS